MGFLPKLAGRKWAAHHVGSCQWCSSRINLDERGACRNCFSALLRDTPPVARKEARKRNWSEAEKLAIIDEPGEARNKNRLDLAGTMYETGDGPDDLILFPLFDL